MPALKTKLGLESLEAREVPAVATWTFAGPGAGDWHDPANWQGGYVPQTFDVVQANAGTGSINFDTAVPDPILGGLITPANWNKDIYVPDGFVTFAVNTQDATFRLPNNGSIGLIGGTIDDTSFMNSNPAGPGQAVNLYGNVLWTGSTTFYVREFNVYGVTSMVDAAGKNLTVGEVGGVPAFTSRLAAVDGGTLNIANAPAQTWVQVDMVGAFSGTASRSTLNIYGADATDQVTIVGDVGAVGGGDVNVKKVRAAASSWTAGGSTVDSTNGRLYVYGSAVTGGFNTAITGDVFVTARGFLTFTNDVGVTDGFVDCGNVSVTGQLVGNVTHYASLSVSGRNQGEYVYVESAGAFSMGKHTTYYTNGGWNAAGTTFGHSTLLCSQFTADAAANGTRLHHTVWNVPNADTPDYQIIDTTGAGGFVGGFGGTTSPANVKYKINVNDFYFYVDVP